jgi:hypothetical protein
VTPQQVHHYFEGLVTRVKHAVAVPCESNPSSAPNRCHKTVEAFVAAHAGCEAVRGWLATPNPGIHMFHAHSVARRPDGRLTDVTPGAQHREGMVFLEHRGPDSEYEYLMGNCAQWFHPPPTNLPDGPFHLDSPDDVSSFG